MTSFKRVSACAYSGVKAIPAKKTSSLIKKIQLISKQWMLGRGSGDKARAFFKLQ